MEKKIFELINESKKDNRDSLIELIQRFSPLISKYTRKLNYEDAENDLIEHFIVTVKKMPIMTEPKEIRYIQVSIENRYIYLSKKAQLYKEKIVLLDPSEENFFKDFSVETFSMDMKDALKALSEREKNILINRYIYGYGDDEIGQGLSISRQAVHKARRKALNHLDQYLKKGVI